MHRTFLPCVKTPLRPSPGPTISNAGPAATVSSSDLFIKRPVLVGALAFQAPSLDSAAALLNPKGRLQDYCMKNKVRFSILREAGEMCVMGTHPNCVPSLAFDSAY